MFWRDICFGIMNITCIANIFSKNVLLSKNVTFFARPTPFDHNPFESLAENRGLQSHTV